MTYILRQFAIFLMLLCLTSNAIVDKKWQDVIDTMLSKCINEHILTSDWNNINSVSKHMVPCSRFHKRIIFTHRIKHLTEYSPIGSVLMETVDKNANNMTVTFRAAKGMGYNFTFTTFVVAYSGQRCGFDVLYIFSGSVKNAFCGTKTTFGLNTFSDVSISLFAAPIVNTSVEFLYMVINNNEVKNVPRKLIDMKQNPEYKEECLTRKIKLILRVHVFMRIRYMLQCLDCSSSVNIYEGLYIRDIYKKREPQFVEVVSVGPSITIIVLQDVDRGDKKNNIIPKLTWRTLSQNNRLPDKTIQFKSTEKKKTLSVQHDCPRSHQGVRVCIFMVGGNPYGANQTKLEINELEYHGPDIDDCFYGGSFFLEADKNSGLSHESKMIFRACSNDSVWLNEQLTMSFKPYYIFILAYERAFTLNLTLSIHLSECDHFHIFHSLLNQDEV